MHTKGVVGMEWLAWVFIAVIFVASYFVGKGLSLKKPAEAPKAQPVPLAQPTQPPSNEYSKRIENCLSGHFSRLCDRRNFNRFDKFRGRKSDLP